MAVRKSAPPTEAAIAAMAARMRNLLMHGAGGRWLTRPAKRCLLEMRTMLGCSAIRAASGTVGSCRNFPTARDHEATRRRGTQVRARPLKREVARFLLRAWPCDPEVCRSRSPAMIASASGRSHPRSAGFMPARPGRGGSQCIVNTADAAIDAARAGLGITKALSYRLRLALATAACALFSRISNPSRSRSACCTVRIACRRPKCDASSNSRRSGSGRR